MPRIIVEITGAEVPALGFYLNRFCPQPPMRFSRHWSWKLYWIPEKESVGDVMEQRGHPMFIKRGMS
jgi:hypothetical protein